MKMKVALFFGGTVRKFDADRFNDNIATEGMITIASLNEIDKRIRGFKQYVDQYHIPHTWTFVDTSIDWLNKNSVSMFYHNKRAFDHIESMGIPFDVIVKFRSDINTTSKFPYPTSIPEDNTIYVPEEYHYSGINDQIAYGNYESMRIYCSVYDNIYKYCTTDDVTFHPETLLKYHLDSNNITVKTFPFSYFLQR